MKKIEKVDQTILLTNNPYHIRDTIEQTQLELHTVFTWILILGVIDVLLNHWNTS